MSELNEEAKKIALEAAKEVAAQLAISVKTVETHRAR